MSPSKKVRRARAWPAMVSACLLLSACGGDGGSGGAVSPTSTPRSEMGIDVTPEAPMDAATASSGLVPTQPVVVESTRTATLVVKAVGALAGGGHAVVWMSRDAESPDAAWTLWLQRFDPRGQKAGSAVRLEHPRDIEGPENVAVTVLPEGRIGVTFLTDRVEDTAFAITEIHHWPFNLAGEIAGPQRVLDAERYGRFSPRFARLDGPLDAAAGRDGSQYVSWRYRIVGAAPLAPSVRAQRLAADGAPLDWIQRLDGVGGFSRVFDVDLTSLDEGGWVVSLERVSPEGVRYRDLVQLDLARPLGLSQEPLTPGSFLLDLRGHGSVLFSQAVDTTTGAVAGARQIHFNRLGRGRARALPALPVGAVALAGGDYVILYPDDKLLSAQRYIPAGDPVGAPVGTLVSVPGVSSAGLRGGGMVLVWVATLTDGEVRLLSQRFSQEQP